MKDNESTIKPVHWVGSAKRDFKAFPKSVQEEAGYGLYVAQRGGHPSHAKPLKGLSGVTEIVTRYDSDTYRSVYVANMGDAIYVLHAFKKKSNKGISTPKKEIDLIRQRLAQAKEAAKGEKK